MQPITFLRTTTENNILGWDKIVLLERQVSMKVEWTPPINTEEHAPHRETHPHTKTSYDYEYICICDGALMILGADDFEETIFNCYKAED